MSVQTSSLETDDTSGESETPSRNRGSKKDFASNGQPTDMGSSQESGTSSGASSTSTEPTKFRRLSEIYDEAQEVEVENELLLAGMDEPTDFEQEVKERPWKLAMQHEIEAIERNNTWRLVDLPLGHKAIGFKWVYKIKRDANGEIVKHKARWWKKDTYKSRVLILRRYSRR